MLLPKNNILRQHPRALNSNIILKPIIVFILVAPLADAGDRHDAIPDLELAHLAANSHDLAGPIRARDAAVLESRGVVSDEHAEVTVVERDGVDFDDDVIGTERRGELLVGAEGDGEAFSWGRGGAGGAAPGGVG